MWEFDNERPIYIQLMEKLKIAIVNGSYQPGEKLPSVREFAYQLKVNPNTLQKALNELENQGFIITKRTNGKYVTDDQKLHEKAKIELANELVDSYIMKMQQLGYQRIEAIQYLEKKGNM